MKNTNLTLLLIKINKTIISIILLLSFFTLYNCSSDPKEDTLPETENTKSKSILITTDCTMPSTGMITVEYDDSPKEHDIDKVVDLIKDSYFYTNHDKVWITWKNKTPFVADTYFLTSSISNPENDPVSWVMYASADNTNWVPIDKQSNVVFSSRLEKKIFKVSISKEYLFYKIVLQGDNPSSSIQLSQWGITQQEELEDKDDPKSIKIEGESTMIGSGVLTAQFSDSPKNEDINNLVDLNEKTTYTSHHKKVWLTWQSDGRFNANIYYLTSAAEDANNDPRSVALYGSNDNKFWFPLDQQERVKFSKRNEQLFFSFTNNEAFIFYKIELTAQEKSSIKLSQWGLVASYDDSDLIKKYSRRNKHSEKTPMGTIFENCRKTTTEDLEWLANPTNEPKLIDGLDATWQKKTISNLYPFGDANMADINQHAIGDCSGIAALGSLAYMHPEYIKSIITKESDDVYVVTMFDPQGERIKVKLSSTFLSNTKGEVVQVTSKNNQLCWSTVLEKAIMKYNDCYDMNPYIGGIGSDAMIAPLVGNGDSYAYDSWEITPDDMQRAVRASLARGEIVTAFFTKGDQDFMSYKTQTKTVNAHGYSVSLSRYGNQLFSMRNPWGWHPNNILDGLLDIPTSQEVNRNMIICVMSSGKAGDKSVYMPYNPPL